MPTQQERRESERLADRGTCPFKLTNVVGADAVRLTEGFAYSINRSVSGMMLLVSEEMDKRQVFEILVPSETWREPTIKLGEVRWVRPIPVSTRVKMYVVGIRFLFDLPAYRPSPQT